MSAAPDSARKCCTICPATPSEEAVAALPTATGFGPPAGFFSSLFWGAWLARRL